MLVITVSFQSKPAHAVDFLREMKINARDSLALEHGCRQFDVCVAPEDECQVFLYELYDSRAAFDAHLASAHFQRFIRVTESWIESKQIKEYRRHD